MAGLEEIPADSGIIVPGEDIKKVAFGVDMKLWNTHCRELGVDLVITITVGALPAQPVKSWKASCPHGHRQVPINKAQGAAGTDGQSGQSHVTSTTGPSRQNS